MSRLKWNMCFRYFDHILYRNDNLNKKKRKENHVNSDYSEENLTQSAQHDLGVFLQGKDFLNPDPNKPPKMPPKTSGKV